MNKRLISVGVVLILVVGLVAGIYFSLRSPQPTEVKLEDVQPLVDDGRYEEAREQLKQFVVANPQNAEAHFLLGLAHFNLEEYGPAEEAFHRSLELDVDRAAAVHHNLGALAYQTGEIETAIAEFQAALEIDPDDSDSHYQLGAAYLVKALPSDATSPPDEASLKKAETQFEHALELKPNKPEALVGLSNVYMLQNRLDEAISLLDEALEQNPQMREALFALGRAYAAAGQVEKAKETLQRFLATDPPSVWAQQAEELLRQLGE